MLYFLASLLSGHALGAFVRKKALAYWLSPAVAVVAYVLAKLSLGFIKDVSPSVSAITIVAGILYTPLVALGVYLARRKLAANGYASEPGASVDPRGRM